MSNWKHASGNFNQTYDSTAPLNRFEAYKNRAANAKVGKIFIYGYKDGSFAIAFEFSNWQHRDYFVNSHLKNSSLRNALPNIQPESNVLQFFCKQEDKENIGIILDLVHEFEPINPYQVRLSIKRKFGLKRLENKDTILDQLKNMYKNKGLQKTIEQAKYAEDKQGYKGILHAFAQHLLEQKEEVDAGAVFMHVKNEDLHFELANSVLANNSCSSLDNNAKTVKAFEHLCLSGDKPDFMRDTLFAQLCGYEEGHPIEGVGLNTETLLNLANLIKKQRDEIIYLKTQSKQGLEKHQTEQKKQLQKIDGQQNKLEKKEDKLAETVATQAKIIGKLNAHQGDNNNGGSLVQTLINRPPSPTKYTNTAHLRLIGKMQQNPLTTLNQDVTQIKEKPGMNVGKDPNAPATPDKADELVLN